MPPSPTPAPRTRLPPEERQRQLLEHALAVFAAKGLARASHAEIAERAGVSIPTVFNYFRTREKLVEAVLDEVEEHFLALARAVYASHDDGIEALRAHAHTFLEAAAERSAHLTIWLEWSASVGKPTWPRYVAFQARLVELATGAVERAQAQGRLPAGWPAAELGYFFVGCAHMVVLRLHATGQTPAEVGAYVDFLIEELLVART